MKKNPFHIPLNYWQITIREWNYCMKNKLSNTTIISLNAGIIDNYYEIYLQNLFCNYLNVKIIYIYKNTHFLDYVWHGDLSLK